MYCIYSAGAGSEWLNGVWESMRVKLSLQGASKGVLILDEVQKIAGWSETVKRNWDKDTCEGTALKVLLSGSSRMMIQEGLSESLFGRFEQHYLAHWTYPEMRDAFGLSADQYAFFGTYPATASLLEDEQRFKSYVQASVVEASLNQGIFLMSKIDKPALLRRLFELGTRYSGQMLSYNKVLGQLQDAGNTTTLARYLHLLDQAGLLAGLEKYSVEEVRSRASSPKYQVHNNALLSVALMLSFNEARADQPLWGRIVESAVGAYLTNEVRRMPNCRLLYWNRDSKEVDFVLVSGSVALGIEVKSAEETARAKGLEAFKKEFPNAKTLLLGQGISWQELLETPLDKLIAAVC